MLQMESKCISDHDTAGSLRLGTEEPWALALEAKLYGSAN